MSEAEERRERLLFIGLALIICLLPLPLGGARPLAWDVMGLAVAFLLLGALSLSFAAFGGLRRDLSVPLLLFGAVVGFAWLQSSDLAPSAWHDPLWRKAGEALGREVAGHVAADPQLAAAHLFRLLAYGGVFLLAAILARNPRRAKKLIALVAVTGTAYALYGLIVYWSGNNRLLWFAKWAYGGDLTSSFVNRNSFSTYLGLAIMAALAYLGSGLAELDFYGDRRDKARIVIEYLGTRWWLLASLCLLVIALLLTHSRGGFLSCIAGALAMLLAMARAPSLKRLGKAGLVVILPMLALLLAAMVSSGRATFERLLLSGQESAERRAVDRLLLQAIGDHPLVGTGLGSFFSVFARYRGPDIASYYDLAHNDYLQNMLELGLPAAGGLLLCLLWLAALCLRGIRVRRKDAVLPCLGLSVTILVGLHAASDFSLQIPAVTVTYLVLLAAAVAQSRSYRRGDDQGARVEMIPTAPPPVSAQAPRRLGALSESRWSESAQRSDIAASKSACAPGSAARLSRMGDL